MKPDSFSTVNALQEFALQELYKYIYPKESMTTWNNTKPRFKGQTYPPVVEGVDYHIRRIPPGQPLPLSLARVSTSVYSKRWMRQQAAMYLNRWNAENEKLYEDSPKDHAMWVLIPGPRLKKGVELCP